MSTTDTWLAVLAGVLVVLAAGFASVESALSRVSRVRVDELLREGRRRADVLKDVISDPARYLNVLTLLRVACELVATVLVAAVCLAVLPERWQAVLVAAAVMVVVSYIAVGVSPRTVGLQHADGLALATAGLVRGTARVLGPVPQLLILLGNALTPGRGFRDGPFASEAELRDLVDQAQESRLIEDEERAMIHSVFELGDTIVREVMVPRTDIVYLERHKTLRQALSLALRSGFSRIPVVGDGGLDDVVGMVYVKDLVRRTHEYREGETTERVDSVMREASFVPESKPVDALLREMQQDQTHIAVVVDEYGGTAGIVTIEDVLEEIVGDIADEYDREAPQVEQLADGGVRVSTRLHVDELGELFGVDLEDDDVDTVGGLLAKHLGMVPIPGSRTVVEGLELTAEAATGRRNRVGTLVVRRAEEALGERADSGERVDA
ncbi:hemolysin family protein [Vallicoccus soli]|uniref:HlyC/CorC family transporter n=1 Tax=Vallicoccus soli TaxID=2339232 RepID=A0A3A3Z2W3_9ACTN|nr:hemolysin family protein [Vallicoccus soli]RJK97039.1 HlyC/CorC family transporter [Vallicoccus soli]